MGREISGTEGHSYASSNAKCQNKRKCLSDLTFHLPNQPPPLSLTEFPRYELLVPHFQSAVRQLEWIVEKSRNTNECEKLKTLEADAEWEDPITLELEELLSRSLSTTFANAVRKLIWCGYTEETAKWAILSSSNFNGSEDIESNIIEGALSLLKMNEHVKMPKKSMFKSLQTLIDYTLLQMIHVVWELRPELPVAEVMWCLLVSDLDLAGACGLKWGPKAHGGTPEEPSGAGQLDSSKSGTLKSGDPRSQKFQPETPAVGPAQYRKPGPGGLGKETAFKEGKVRFSGASDMDEKQGTAGSKKAAPIHFKRDLLRQKAIHFEKNYRGRLTKESFKAKVAAWENMVLDQSLKLHSGDIMMENHSRLSFSEGDEVNSGNPPLSDKDLVSALPAVNPDSRLRVDKVDFLNSPKVPTDYFSLIPFDDNHQECLLKDEKDQLLSMILPLKALLEREIQGWYDWANEKVMQVAQKLGKEQAELKALRQEKEDSEKSKKEKQTVAESTVKRLGEMDHALANATDQIELANCTIKRLEAENNVLMREMEKARMEARGSIVKLDEAIAKEKETMKKLQVWEVEKVLLTEKLTIGRREIAGLENQIEKAKNRQNQFKVLLRQEEKERQKVEGLLDSLREKREKQEALLKAESDNINQTAQTEKQKFEDSIKNLQNKISAAKLESDKKKVANLNMGYGQNVPYTRRRLPVFQAIVESGNVKEERECVMCMTDEVSVVFLPCCHQVLCGRCNGLHEKKGMKDCPSCRGMIDDRVSVCFRE